ncbi:hypothetical protein [Pseudoalteromonas maricaloris]|uniref:Transposase n=1 Tax=Pseudoalteromonas maricaloris TaxID=184924 RepID=A0ABZ0MC65_9GAMM|nr:hypothetical protein [Pseudoalteromonas maricaloris]WOX29415.1 hypothetical protein R5H13_03840 [Pseudoalteromonas maricaloris]
MVRPDEHIPFNVKSSCQKGGLDKTSLNQKQPMTIQDSLYD